MSEQILVATTEHIAGYEVTETLGEVFGLTTRSKNIFSNIGAGLKNIVGGEIRAYTDMLGEARVQAVDRMREHAVSLGADAIVMMRFDSDSIGQDMTMVAAYGTAVKMKKVGE